MYGIRKGASSTKSEDDEDRDQRKIDWKIVIFLPFNPYFQFAVVISILFTIFFTVFEIGFQNIQCPLVTFCVWTVEGIYAVDWFLRIMHRILRKVSSRRVYEAKPLYTFALDFLSLGPIYLILKEEDMMGSHSLLKANRFLRLYRLISIFNIYNNSLTLNHIAFIYLTHFITFVFIAHALSAVMFYSSCWKCPFDNWSQDLKEDFDPLNINHWYFICLMCTTGIISRNWRGNIRGETTIERVFVSCLMVIGMMVEYALVSGKLISVYIKQRQRQASFEQELRVTMRILHIRDVDKETENRILKYYKYLWHRRSGVLSVPFLTELPLSLQKDIDLDIFWDTCQHSETISQFNIPFKRSLALHMHTKFYLPGDYVIRKGELQSRMFYIVTGVLQILTEEEGESAVFSFSSGTCLGEFTLMRPCVSRIDVKSATYCEVHVLSLKDMIQTLPHFPGHAKLAVQIIDDRIKKAKGRVEIKQTLEGSGIQYNEIKWIKKHWRLLSKADIEVVQKNKILVEGDVDKVQDEDGKILAQHTSQHLKKIVLSEKIELKTNITFIKTNFPWILDPNCSFIRIWGAFSFCTTLCTCILYPYFIAFEGEFNVTMEAINFWITITYCFDVFFQCITAIKTKDGGVITKFGTIFHTKTREFLFILDIASAIPLEVPVILFKKKKQVIALYRVNRMCKIFKFIYRIYIYERSLNAHTAWIRLITYFFIYTFIIYCCSAFVYFTSCPNGPNNICETFSWYSVGIYKGMESKQTIKRFLNAFVVSYYYCMSVLLKQGLSDEYPVSMVDVITFSVFAIIAYFLSVYFFTEFCAIQVVNRKRMIGFQEVINDLKKHMSDCQMDPYTRDRVFNYMYFQWDHNFATSILRSNETLLEDSNEDIRRQVLFETLADAIRHIPLFLDTEPAFVESIATIAKFYALNENTTLTEPGVRSCSLNIIRKGYCLLQSHLPGDLERAASKVLGPGSHFPIIEFFHQIPSLVTVKTITHCEVVTIDIDQMTDMLRLYSTVDEELKEVIKEQEELHNISKLKGIKTTIYTIGKADEYGVLYLDHDENDYIKPWEKFGNFSFIRYLLFKRIIKPTSKYLLYWEIGRATFAVLSVISTPLAKSALLEYRYFREFLFFLDITGWLDIYVKFHVGYFNERKLLVQHPLYTAWHYITHSFLVDVIATMPIPLLEQAAQLIQMKNRGDETALVVTSLTRCLQLYRFYFLCSYLESDALKDRRHVTLVRYWVTIVIVLNFIACALPVFSCSYKARSNCTNCQIDVICTDDLSIIAAASKYTDINDPFTLYLVAMYCVSGFFTLTGDGTVQPKSVDGHVSLILVGTLVFFLRGMFLALVACITLIGNISLTVYQDKMKNLVRFMKTEGVDPDIGKLAIDHFEHEWSRCHGTPRYQVFLSLHPTLREAVCFGAYSKSLRKITLFRGAEESFFREMCRSLAEVFYVNKEKIIQSNDVISDVYITCKGNIEVIDENEERITLLPAGSMFGNLRKKTSMRMNLNVLAKSNLSILSISTRQLYRIVEKYPVVAERLKKEVILHPDLLVQHGSSKGSDLSFETKSIASLHHKMKHRMNIWFTEQSRFYQIWKFFVCLIGSYISIIWTLLNLSLMMEDFIVINTVLYFLDFTFLLKIIMEFLSSYLHPETGLYVTDFKLIALRYLKTWHGFTVDILSVLPLDIIALSWDIDIEFVDRDWIYWLKCNRLLRVVTLIKYFHTTLNKLNVNIFLRWIKVLIMQSLPVFFGATVFILTTCYRYHCRYRLEPQEDIHVSKTTRNRQECSAVIYQHILNLFSGSSLQEVTPHHIIDTVVTTVLLLYFQNCIAVMIGDIAAIQAVKNFTRNAYEIKVDAVLSYVKDADLSLCLQKSLQDYMAAFWNKEKGEMLPVFIQQTPPYLQQRLKVEMYGQHISHNAFFSGIHKDLLRQITGKLERCVYFPGDIIVEKQDVDSIMYFIHDGEVEVVERMNYMETVVDILTANTAFGIIQGFQEDRPHMSIYRARTKVEVLTLDRKKWIHLIEFFPSSKREIFSRTNLGL